MKPRAIVKILLICLMAPLFAMPQPGSDFSRPLDEVFLELERRFGEKIRCKRFSPDTVVVRHAASRLRPYSLDESLTNLLAPLDLKWRRTEGITVEPYEYYRRTPAEGERLLAWLRTQYADRASWEQRRDTLLADLRRILDLDPMLRGCVAVPDVILGRKVSHDGYTTRNYALETLPGLYVCGTVYEPEEGRDTPNPLKPLVISPAGHWEGGRYRADQQYRMATFARMGAVAVDLDIVGWGDSELQIGREAHTSDRTMQLQVLFSKRVLDWILASRRDIDIKRIAATGGSGGATHTLLVAAVDGRFAALAPVVHLVSHFDGGCICESGRPVALAGGGSCMPELLAAVMAPRPVLTVSDGGDWTATYPELEYPYLKYIWKLCGAEPAVENAHFEDERHDYGPSKRRAVYDFFARVLRMDAAAVDEARVDIVAREELRMFDKGLPDGAIRSYDELEQTIEKLYKR